MVYVEGHTDWRPAPLSRPCVPPRCAVGASNSVIQRKLALSNPIRIAPPIDVANANCLGIAWMHALSEPSDPIRIALVIAPLCCVVASSQPR